MLSAWIYKIKRTWSKIKLPEYLLKSQYVNCYVQPDGKEEELNL